MNFFRKKHTQPKPKKIEIDYVVTIGLKNTKIFRIYFTFEDAEIFMDAVYECIKSGTTLYDKDKPSHFIAKGSEIEYVYSTEKKREIKI